MDILRSLWTIACLLGPVQSIIMLLMIAFVVWFAIAFYRSIISFNPRHYTDQYVKSHMGEFYSWFKEHPEDKSRYEDTEDKMIHITITSDTKDES